MQWDLLPPLTLRSSRAVVTGLLEPAYEVAGDAFDYSINGRRLDVAVLDGMGHGIGSTAADDAGRRRLPARPAERPGAAGDPRRGRRRHRGPVRRGRVRRPGSSPGCGWTPASWSGPAPGTRCRCCCATGGSSARWPASRRPRSGSTAARRTLQFTALEPGDSVLLYTDGVVEARTAQGTELGLERLVDLLEREAAAETPPEETSAPADPQHPGPPRRHIARRRDSRAAALGRARDRGRAGPCPALATRCQDGTRRPGAPGRPGPPLSPPAAPRCRRSRAARPAPLLGDRRRRRWRRSWRSCWRR